jgi:hypothetical protein
MKFLTATPLTPPPPKSTVKMGSPEQEIFDEICTQVLMLKSAMKTVRAMASEQPDIRQVADEAMDWIETRPT